MSRVFLLGHVAEVTAQRGDWRVARFCGKRIRTKQDEELFGMVDGTNPYELWETLLVKGTFPSGSPLFTYVLLAEDSAEYERREAGGIRVMVLEVRRSPLPTAEHEGDGFDLPVCRFSSDCIPALADYLAVLELRETKGAANPKEEVEWGAFAKKRAAAIRKSAGVLTLQRALQHPDDLTEAQCDEIQQSCARGKFVRWEARHFFERFFWSLLHATVSLSMGTEHVARMRASEDGRALLQRLAVEPWLTSMLDETQHRASLFSPSANSVPSFRRKPVEVRMDALVEFGRMSDDPEREREDAEELERCRLRWALFEDLQSRMRGYGALGLTVEDAVRAKIGPSREAILEALRDLEKNGVIRLCEDQRNQPYFFTRLWDKDVLLHGLVADLLSQPPPAPRSPDPESAPIADPHVAEFVQRALESSVTLLDSRYGVLPLDYLCALLSRLDSEAVVVLCDGGEDDGSIACENKALVEPLVSEAERAVSFALAEKRLTTAVFVTAHKLDSWRLHQAVRRLGESVGRLVLVIDRWSRGAPSADLFNPNPCRVLWNLGAGIAGLALVEAKRSHDQPLSRSSQLCLSVLSPDAPGPHIVTYDKNDKTSRALLFESDTVVLATTGAERDRYTKAILAAQKRAENYPHRIACEKDIFYFRRQRLLATVVNYWFELRSGVIRHFSDSFDARQVPADCMAAVFRARPLHGARKEVLVRIPAYEGKVSGVEHGRAVLLHQLPPHKLPFVAVVCSATTRSEHLYAAAESCDGTLLLLGDSAAAAEQHRKEALSKRPYGPVTPLSVMLASEHPPAPKRHKKDAKDK